MSGGAWSSGPPKWVTSEKVSEVQHTAESHVAAVNQSSTTINNHARTSADFDGNRNRYANPQSKRMTVRRDTSPWYPGKVNRNRKRDREDDEKSIGQLKKMTSPSSATSRTTLSSSGSVSDITVANVHKKDLNGNGFKDLVEWTKHPNHLYIGRDMTRFVPGAVHSKWHNPFKSKQMGREMCCKQYREYIITGKTKHENGKTLFESLHELKGMTLGCWCHPERCHGHVLRELVKEFCP